MNNRNIGTKAEQLAIKYLEDKGYSVVDTNYFSRYGEVDIIALKDEYICFIEVKYRKNDFSGVAENAISLTKMKKICRTANYYLYRNRQYLSFQMRFDVVAINGTLISLYENAFPYVEYN